MSALDWRQLHPGYYVAADEFGNDVDAVVRTRPLGDGWMAIFEGYVLDTGLLRHQAQHCVEHAYEVSLREMPCGGCGHQHPLRELLAGLCSACALEDEYLPTYLADSMSERHNLGMIATASLDDIRGDRPF